MGDPVRDGLLDMGGRVRDGLLDMGGRVRDGLPDMEGRVRDDLLGMEGLPVAGGRPGRAGPQTQAGPRMEVDVLPAASLRVRGSRPLAAAADREPDLLPMGATALPGAVDLAATRGLVRAAVAERGQAVAHPVKEAATRGAAIGLATVGLSDRAACEFRGPAPARHAAHGVRPAIRSD